MAPRVIIDEYNLVITLLITIAWQLTGFFIAWTLQVCRLLPRTGCFGGDGYVD